MRRLSDFANRVLGHLLFGLGLTMAAIVSAQVFARYLLNNSIFWSEELSRFLLIWLTFLGAPYAYRLGAHASIDLLRGRLPSWGRRAAALASHLVTLVFSGVMIYFGTGFAWFVRDQISPALHLPKWVPHGIIPVSGLILALHAAAFLIEELKRGEDG